MRRFFRAHVVFIVLVLLIGVGAIVFVTQRDTSPEWTTDTVSQGTVSNIISVSGTIDADNSAELAFPAGGILESLGVREGDSVSKDHVLATLVHTDLKADFQDAEASVHIAEADLDELISGMRNEERDVTKTTTDIAEANLARVIREQEDAVTSAYWKLLSSDLEARPKSLTNNDTPPTISGTYFCDEGEYVVTTYPSKAQSGYSYTLSGLESGTFTAYTDTPSALGTCGLKIVFDPDTQYGNAEWIISIPNMRGASYVDNFNAYTIAKGQRDNAVEKAQQELTLARQNQTVDLADPRDESLTRARARVSQAQARLSAVSAQINDHLLRAPFDGVITHIEPVSGETVGTSPIVTMVSNTSYALSALIPEIDVTKIRVGQKASIAFDARAGETFTATVTFISPLAREIDGVSYFEAKLTLDTPPDWLRSGLNADIDIIVDRHENVVRIPKRYLTGTEGAYTVLIPKDTTAVPTPVTVEFMGNDGFVEIRGLSTGDTIIAP